MNYINPNRENYLDELVHDNTFRHGGINLSVYLVNSYILNIEKKVVSNHLSILPLTDEQKERLERIYRLHRRGYSTWRICDSMNQKYGTKNEKVSERLEDIYRLPSISMEFLGQI